MNVIDDFTYYETVTNEYEAQEEPAEEQYTCANAWLDDFGWV